MNHGNVNLAALIGSRICHDLISPIGAIHNGLELLDMTGGVSGPEMGLIADSVENADARIRFFRLAYGAPSDHAVAHGEITQVLDDVTRGGRLEVVWRPAGDVTRHEVRLAFLALQCCETAMPYGGRVEIDEAAGRWKVHGQAERLMLDAPLWDSLTSEDARVEITPALVQFALLPLAVAERGRALEVETGSMELCLRF